MRKYTLLIFLFLSGLWASGASPGDSLAVELITRERSLEPGKLHNLVFKLTNNTHDTLHISSSLSLPEGLRLAIPPREVSLLPGATGLIMASIALPGSFPTGKYSLKASFFSPPGRTLLAETEGDFSVKAKEGFSFERLTAPDYVRGGEEITATWTLRNNGNSRRKFILTPYNCNLVTPATETLDPGESVTVRAKVSTSKEVSALSKHTFSVEVSLAAPAEEATKTTRRDFRSVTIYPLREAEDNLWFRYPVTLSSRALVRGKDGRTVSGYQLEARGSGFLDTARLHKIEFLARGPNNSDLSFLGLYDEYSLAYTSRRFESFIGDKSFHVTPLMETSRYGTGTENTYITAKGSRIGFLYVKPRFYKEINSEAAAYADFRIAGDNRVGIHLLSKKNHHLPEPATLGSLTARLIPFRNSSAEFEYSLGSSEGKKDHAYRIFLHAYHPVFTLTGSYYNAGQFYPGYYNNSVFYNGNFSLNLTRKWSLGLSAREDFSNAAQDTLLSTAPYSRMVMASSFYKATQNLSVRLYYLDHSSTDRMPEKKFDYRNTTMNAEVDHHIRKFNYTLRGEYGQTTNFLGAAGALTQNSIRTSFHLTYRPNYLLNFQAFTSWSNMNSFIAQSSKNWIWGFSAHGQLARNLRTTMQVQNNYTIDQYYLNRNLFQLSFDYRFLKRHSLTFGSYYMLFQNKTENPEFTFSLTYALKLGIPLKKTGDAGTLSGSLTKTDGTPAAGVIFTLNGRSAITDGNGTFEFRNLPPGNYQLISGRGKMAIDEITDLPMPLSLEIRPREVTGVSLRLVKAARIKGKLAVQGVPGNNQAGEPQTPGLGNIVVELRDSLETIRIVTQPSGDFEFPRLRPGHWTLHVYKNNLDPRYTLPQERSSFTVTAGETRNVLVPVVPKTKTIIFKPAPVQEVPSPDATRKNR